MIQPPDGTPYPPAGDPRYQPGPYWDPAYQNLPPGPSPYQTPPYGGTPYGGVLPTPPAVPRSGLLDRLGPRALRRPEPRFGVSLAAAGVALAILGILIWAFGYVGDGYHVSFDDQTGTVHSTGSGRRFLGAGLSLVLTVAGFALVMVRRRGPLATAGVIGSAIGVPLTLAFLTLDLNFASSAGGYPVNLDAVVLVSVAVWLVSYLGLRGTRGRAVYLGLAASYFAVYLEYKVAGTFTNAVSSLSTGTTADPSGSLPGGFGGGGDGAGGVAAVGLTLGLGYYAVAALLDHRGRAGAAIALVYAGFVVTTTGIVASVQGFGQVGTGIELIVVGAALCAYGGRYGRRFTTWAWAAAVVGGIAVIVQRIARDNTTAFGLTLIVLGAAVVVAAQVITNITHEPAEIDTQAALASGPTAYPAAG